ncbi:MAG TPA: glycosyl transferase family 2 [Bacillota bacterium]|nr:glycosyl transferase family 2 [Bacillota bacterium]
MGKYKICVYSICKNEAGFVDRWMDSMQEADCVVVTDTGSGDDTVERLKGRGAKVYTERIDPWRFDVARNISLSHVPEDADICVCTDLDELFVPGWRALLEEAWRPGAKKGKYLYNWMLKEDGTPVIQIYYAKMHTRNDYKWVFPVHENLKYCGTEPEKDVFVNGVVSYLPLLELAVADDPESDRMSYYLGREYMYKGMWEKCIEELQRYLKLETATWKEERCAAMRWIAQSCYKQGRMMEAAAWYYRAIAEMPYMRDPYVEFAQMAYELENWPVVFCMMEEALKIKSKSTVYVNMGYAWDQTPDDLCAVACYRLGMYERSLLHAQEALRLRPNDERLINNLKSIEERLSDVNNGCK